MEDSKFLIIENANKMIGTSYWNVRFTCINVVETEANYRFQFSDFDNKNRYIWIEVGRFARWDDGDKKWYYRIQDNRHFVSADYFTFDNAIKSFGERLKEYM